MSLRPIPKLNLTLNDQKEYSFLLSAGGMKRIKEELGIKTVKELLDRDAVDVAIPVLWEALLEKPQGWNRDTLADLLPAHLEGLTRSVLSLLGMSLPDAEKRPTGGAPATEAPKTEPTIQ